MTSLFVRRPLFDTVIRCPQPPWLSDLQQSSLLSSETDDCTDAAIADPRTVAVVRAGKSSARLNYKFEVFRQIFPYSFHWFASLCDHKTLSDVFIVSKFKQLLCFRRQKNFQFCIFKWMVGVRVEFWPPWGHREYSPTSEF